MVTAAQAYWLNRKRRRDRRSEAEDTGLLRNATLANTSRIRAMIERVWQGEGNGLVICAGDSKTQGSGAGTGGTLLTGAYELAWPARWAARMRTLDADVDYVLNAFIGNNGSGASITSYRDDIAVGSGWSAVSNSLGGGYWDNSTTLDALSWTPGFAFDKIKVYWLRSTGYATVDVEVDGVSATTFSTAGASGFQSTEIDATGDATSVISIKRTGVGANARIALIEAWDSAASIVKVWNCGVSGARASTINLTTNPWSYRNALVAAAPDAVIVDIGTNDTASVTPAAFKADLQGFIDAVKPIADIVLRRFVSRNPASVDYETQLAIADAVVELAELNDLPWVNMWDLFGTYDETSAKYFDSTHLLAIGYDEEAEFEFQAWQEIAGMTPSGPPL